jgi:Mg2+/citrate symporter
MRFRRLYPEETLAYISLIIAVLSLIVILWLLNQAYHSWTARHASADLRVD